MNKSVFQSLDDVLEYIKPLQETGKKIVTTNGCFDLLHAGHVQYLYEAKALGDVLIVGLNADASVRKLKGETRPIQNENDRTFIMGALEMVDCAFIFHEDTPLDFLEKIRPAFHVKGGDYTENIIEKPVVEKHGGKIAIVSFKEGRSTTSIVERINQ